jgi:hypothetical protein
MNVIIQECLWVITWNVMICERTASPPIRCSRAIMGILSTVLLIDLAIFSPSIFESITCDSSTNTAEPNHSSPGCYERTRGMSLFTGKVERRTRSSGRL